MWRRCARYPCLCFVQSVLTDASLGRLSPLMLLLLLLLLLP
jgi:hypothetical protein